MNRHLGFDFKAAGLDRERFDVTSGQHAVAGKAIVEPASEERAQQAVEEQVSPSVTRRVGIIACTATRGYDHVEVFRAEQINQPRRCVGVVGAVTIRKDIYIGIDCGECAADCISFATQCFHENLGARSMGDLGSAIGRPVVNHIHYCIGERSLEAGDGAANGRGFVEAWQHDGDAFAGLSGATARLALIPLRWLAFAHRDLAILSNPVILDRRLRITSRSYSR